MDRVKFGVLGLGLGYNRAREIANKITTEGELLQTDGGILEAVCDIDSKRLKEATEELHCKGYSDFDEMLDDNSINVIYVATPSGSHNAASSSDTPSGIARGSHSSMAMYSAYARTGLASNPIVLKLKRGALKLESLPGGAVPPPPTTRSPSLQRVTSEPTETMVPQYSCPITVPGGGTSYRKACTSVPQIAQYLTLTSTWFA